LLVYRQADFVMSIIAKDKETEAVNSTHMSQPAPLHDQNISQPVLGTPIVLPNTISPNHATPVTISIPIPSPLPLPGSVSLLRLSGKNGVVLGQLHDDGENGDAVAGDGIYTIHIPF